MKYYNEEKLGAITHLMATCSAELKKVYKDYIYKIKLIKKS